MGGGGMVLVGFIHLLLKGLKLCASFEIHWERG